MGNFENLFLGFAIFCFGIGVAFMAVCFWLIPWLWHVARPLLHTVTA